MFTIHPRSPGPAAPSAGNICPDNYRAVNSAHTGAEANGKERQRCETEHKLVGHCGQPDYIWANRKTTNIQLPTLSVTIDSIK